MPIGRFGTVSEAAQHFGVSRQRIHQLMRRGLLGPTRKINALRGYVWLIPYPFVRRPAESGVHMPDCPHCGVQTGGDTNGGGTYDQGE